MVQYWRLVGACACVLATLGLLTGRALAQEPYTISVETANRIAVHVNGRPPQVDTSPGAVERTLTGTESSECRAYGRASSGTARAGARILSRNPGAVSLGFQSDAVAQGGHYRTCGGCALGNCVGVMGHDTSSHSEASSSARVTIQFHEKLLHNEYELRIASAGQTGPFAVTVTNRAGAITTLADHDSGIYRITAESNDVYFVDLKLGVAASNTGGCCHEQNGGTVQVSLQLQKAPLLDRTKSFEPYIIGGTPTSRHRNVVALLIDGRMHCSGTVIGRKTLLTAAHCLYGYEVAIRHGRMSFVIGERISRPDSAGLIEDFDYPRSDGLRFNPSYDSLEHDIGVVYTQDPVGTSPATLHANQPPWESLTNNVDLEFVGFGLTRWDGTPNDAGVKREAGWKVSSADARRFYFRAVANRNTCKGDSGGPTFVPVNGSRLLVGVTSAGDDQCTQGFNTRVDAYRAWIDPRIR